MKSGFMKENQANISLKQFIYSEEKSANSYLKTSRTIFYRWSIESLIAKRQSVLLRTESKIDDAKWSLTKYNKNLSFWLWIVVRSYHSVMIYSPHPVSWISSDEGSMVSLIFIFNCACNGWYHSLSHSEHCTQYRFVPLAFTIVAHPWSQTLHQATLFLNFSFN